MPKSDTWPGGVAMESLSNLDSAGSCDSVISMNSGDSEDSMEHLSAEERACLMYLEETIEALEVQEDSGLSNDEPDPGLQVDRTGQMKVNDISSFMSDESGRDQRSEPVSRVFTFQDEAEHHALNQTPVPQSTPADLETIMNLMTQPKPPVAESVAESKIRHSATELCVATDEAGRLKIVPSASLLPSQATGASEMDVGVIPPPSDFMDEPGLPPPQPQLKALPPPVGISSDKPAATIDLEQLRQRASVKRTSLSTSVTQDLPNKTPELSLSAISSGPPMSPPPEAIEPRSPPIVSPKPKMLPANIILKSHKAAVAGSDGNMGHSVPKSSDRLLMDPQRIRIEALRKLGLLRDEADLVPAFSPNISPKTRRSWTAPSSPLSPAAPHTPLSKPSYIQFSSPPPSCAPQSPAAVSPSPLAPVEVLPVPADVLPVPADVLPAPAAFSDPVGPLMPADTSEVNTSPLTPPALVKHLTPPKVTSVKSATLEHSGLGLSGYMMRQNSSGAIHSSHLRNSRARPASLGSGKEFTSTLGEGSQVGLATSKEADFRRSLPSHTAFKHAGDSPKLPRSQGISVLICPREENGESRREALRKLGLLRD